MTQEFVLYKQGLELKELGFDQPCFGLFTRLNNQLLIKGMPNQQECEQYFGGILAPTFSQALRWFREKYNLPSHIHTIWQHDWNNYSYQWHITEDKKEWNCIEHFKNYEKAELACLIELIKIVKEKK